MADPGLSKIVAYDPKTAPEKLRILRRVASKMKDDVVFSCSAVKKSPNNAVNYFTGLQPTFVDKIRATRDMEDIEVKIEDVDRSIIYNQLMDLYLNEKVMPTTNYLFLKLNGQIPAHMQLGEFRNYLYKHGFMWKRIMKRKYVVIENPKFVFERHSYLKTIVQYRNEMKVIYFIDEVAFDSKGDTLTMKQSISRKNEPQIRLIYAVTDKGVEFQRFTADFSSDAILKWVKEFLNYISAPSVIVLNNYKHHCEEILPLPNEDSLKKEMCAWLEYFNVSHDPELPKSLLFDLIQRYTNISKKMYVIDSILEKHGHTVLRLPDSIIKLTPATYYFDTLNVNMPDLSNYPDVDLDIVKTCIDEIIGTLNKDHARDYSSVIMAQEKAILLKDMVLDKVMDKVEDFYVVKNNVYDSDLASEDSDSDSD